MKMNVVNNTIGYGSLHLRGFAINHYNNTVTVARMPIMAATCYKTLTNLLKKLPFAYPKNPEICA